jgi:hypothetical protein
MSADCNGIVQIEGNLLALSLSQESKVPAPEAAWEMYGPGPISHPSCVHLETTLQREQPRTLVEK